MHFYQLYFVLISPTKDGICVLWFRKQTDSGQILDLATVCMVLLEVTELPFKRRVIQACDLIVAHVNLTNGLASSGRCKLELLQAVRS